LRIAALRATTVAVPLEAPLRRAAGAHWGRFVRSIEQPASNLRGPAIVVAARHHRPPPAM
jgi:hypothetical protein